MNKENCALKLVNEIILYYDARSKKYQILDLYSKGTRFDTRLVYRRANNRTMTSFAWTSSFVFCTWYTTQYALLFSHCLNVICFTSFAFCYILINYYMFLIIRFFSYFVCFAF